MVTFNEYSGVVSHPDKLFNDEQLQPGDALRELLDSKGWTREELAAITGRSRQNIYEILSGRNGVTPEMAVILGAAFSNEPSYWLKLDAHYRLKRPKQGFDRCRTTGANFQHCAYSRHAAAGMDRRYKVP